MKYNKNEVTGKMRDRIILQNVNRSRSLTGFASESWADVATIWAFAESKLPGSNESIIEGKNTAKNICDFTIRYNQSISEESRVVWGDKLYQVKNLKVSHDRRFISFQGVFYDSYILTGVNVAASVNGIATTSANLKLIMSVIGQANAIASTFGELTVFQQGVVEVAASVNALATSSANLTKVISIDSSVDANANISATPTIVQNIASSVNADANVSADLKLTKTLESSVTGTATATSVLDVVTQGIVSLDASVTATGEITANLLRIATLTSSPSTAADTNAIATLTKVLEATATATAETDASAQLTIPVNATATATAETSANAQLSYTVNAEATATAETSAEAQIVRIISASATALAESSAEASFGVTFVANVEGTANVDNATIARAATMVGSVTGQATVANATLDVASSVDADAQAFITAAGITDITQQGAINTLVTSLKFADLWNKMKAIYPFIGGTASTHKFNLKDPRDLDVAFRIFWSGGITHSANGVQFGGVNGYGNTFLIPSSSLTLNSSHISFYSRTNFNGGYELACQDDQGVPNKTLYLGCRVGGNFVGSIQSLDSNRVIVANTDGRGLYCVSRNSSTSLKSYKNSALQTTNTTTSVNSQSTIPPLIGALNYKNSGGNISISSYSSKQCAFASIGDGLTDADVANLYSAVQVFQTTLERQI